MSGTKAGGLAAAATNKARHGADFYAKIGSQGGKKGKTGGFYANRELARIAGAKGGKISRRGPSKARQMIIVTPPETPAQHLTQWQRVVLRFKGEKV